MLVAIIGTREPTQAQIAKMHELIGQLSTSTDAVISGCAYGIDHLALASAQSLMLKTIGIVPWPRYNADVQAHCANVLCIDDMSCRNDAYQSVRDHHPAPHKLTQGAMKLHARNYGIIHAADKVIAFPKNMSGGTMQGIRLAKALGIETDIYDDKGELV